MTDHLPSPSPIPHGCLHCRWPAICLEYALLPPKKLLPSFKDLLQPPMLWKRQLPTSASGDLAPITTQDKLPGLHQTFPQPGPTSADSRRPHPSCGHSCYEKGCASSRTPQKPCDWCFSKATVGAGPILEALVKAPSK